MQHYAAIYLGLNSLQKYLLSGFLNTKGYWHQMFILLFFKGNGASNTLIKRQFNDESKIKILSFFVFLIQIFVI